MMEASTSQSGGLQSGPDVIVHRLGIKATGFKTRYKRDRVTFDKEEGQKGSERASDIFELKKGVPLNHKGTPFLF